jgi:hypothetical protein
MVYYKSIETKQNKSKGLTKMTISNKVIEILNKDEAAKKMNKAFNEAAERQGITGEEYNKAKQSFLMMMIANNPEAMEVMAREVYAHHNA